MSHTDGPIFTKKKKNIKKCFKSSIRYSYREKWYWICPGTMMCQGNVEWDGGMEWATECVSNINKKKVNKVVTKRKSRECWLRYQLENLGREARSSYKAKSDISGIKKRKRLWNVKAWGKYTVQDHVVKTNVNMSVNTKNTWTKLFT